MFEGTSFGRNLDILHRTMDVAVLRQDVIANNIANAETPNFKRTVLNFETALGQALESERDFENRPAAGARLNPHHVTFERPVDYQTVMPRRVLDWSTTANNNGNNVNLESEVMDLLNNQLRYTIMTESVNAAFQRATIVLR